jgi:3-keto-L-gulonate-6-phosphate decarboxylase
MVVLVVIVGSNITTTKETKEEAQEIDESKYAV